MRSWPCLDDRRAERSVQESVTQTIKVITMAERTGAAPMADTQDLPRATSRKRSDRMLAVLALLESGDTVTLTDLPRGLAVSPATIRRDLADLEDQGLLVRTHGGARALASTPRAE